MPDDLIADGASWLAGVQKDELATTVTYVNSDGSVDVDATRGSSEFDVEDRSGIFTKTESRDFIVHTADLMIGGSEVEPKRGDKVQETGGDTVYIYQVMSPSGGPVWRWWDRDRTRRRIHAKLIDTEAA